MPATGWSALLSGFLCCSVSSIHGEKRNPNPFPTGIRFGFFLVRGAYRIRTGDLYNANRPGRIYQFRFHRTQNFSYIICAQKQETWRCFFYTDSEQNPHIIGVKIGVKKQCKQNASKAPIRRHSQQPRRNSCEVFTYLLETVQIWVIVWIDAINPPLCAGNALFCPNLVEPHVFASLLSPTLQLPLISKHLIFLRYIMETIGYVQETISNGTEGESACTHGNIFFNFTFIRFHPFFSYCCHIWTSQ